MSISPLYGKCDSYQGRSQDRRAMQILTKNRNCMKGQFGFEPRRRAWPSGPVTAPIAWSGNRLKRSLQAVCRYVCPCAIEPGKTNDGNSGENRKSEWPHGELHYSGGSARNVKAFSRPRWLLAPTWVDESLRLKRTHSAASVCRNAYASSCMLIGDCNKNER
jgi:hypothetical protein